MSMKAMTGMMRVKVYRICQPQRKLPSFFVPLPSLTNGKVKTPLCTRNGEKLQTTNGVGAHGYSRKATSENSSNNRVFYFQ